MPNIIKTERFSINNTETWKEHSWPVWCRNWPVVQEVSERHSALQERRVEINWQCWSVGERFSSKNKRQTEEQKLYVMHVHAPVATLKPSDLCVESSKSWALKARRCGRHALIGCFTCNQHCCCTSGCSHGKVRLNTFRGDGETTDGSWRLSYKHIVFSGVKNGTSVCLKAVISHLKHSKSAQIHLAVT